MAPPRRRFLVVLVVLGVAAFATYFALIWYWPNPVKP
jgi:hypothetical protein